MRASCIKNEMYSVVDMTATPALNQLKKEKETLSYLISSILGVLATVIVVAVLSCLIRKYITSKNNQHTRVSQQDDCKGCDV